MSKEMKEEQRATSDESAKNLKAKWYQKIGFLVSLLTPPGMVADEAKATVAIRAAMKKQELHVLLDSLKICSGFLPYFNNYRDIVARSFSHTEILSF